MWPVSQHGHGHLVSYLIESYYIIMELNPTTSQAPMTIFRNWTLISIQREYNILGTAEE